MDKEEAFRKAWEKYPTGYEVAKEENSIGMAQRFAEYYKGNELSHRIYCPTKCQRCGNNSINFFPSFVLSSEDKILHEKYCCMSCGLRGSTEDLFKDDMEPFLTEKEEKKNDIAKRMD